MSRQALDAKESMRLWKAHKANIGIAALAERFGVSQRTVLRYLRVCRDVERTYGTVGLDSLERALGLDDAD